MTREAGYREQVKRDERDLDTVELERTTEPMRAEMLRVILEDEGIAVSTPGFHVTTMRFAGMSISVRVPRADLDRAREALAERGALSSKITVKTPRKWQLATMVALVPGFGAGHLYAGAYLSAGLLFAAEALVLVTLARGLVIHAGFAYFIPKIADALGSREACRRANRKKTQRTLKGWLSPSAMIAATLVPAYLFVMMTYAPEWLTTDDSRAVCTLLARCTEQPLDACLLDHARARAEGWEGYDRRCTRCIEEEQTCSAVVRACSDLCDL